MSYYHINFTVTPQHTNQPCVLCFRAESAEEAVVAARLALFSHNLPNAQINRVVTDHVDHMDWVPTDPATTLDQVLQDFESWASTPVQPISIEDITTQTEEAPALEDPYTPSFNNPFFDDYHLYHPRGGLSTVDYY